LTGTAYFAGAFQAVFETEQFAMFELSATWPSLLGLTHQDTDPSFKHVLGLLAWPLTSQPASTNP
jgi:hypothetical protein